MEKPCEHRLESSGYSDSEYCIHCGMSKHEVIIEDLESEIDRLEKENKELKEKLKEREND